jgi:hypothetical protein
LRGDGAARADLKVSVAWPDEDIVQRSLLPENPSNGGFPEPPPSMSVRIVAAKHEACGKSTRVRLPSAVPARAVHRLRCDHCERAFEIGEVDDFGLESELTDLEKAVPLNRKKRRTPSLKLPKIAAPKLTKPKLSKPKRSTPKLSKPKLAKPKLSAPKLSAPKLSKPKIDPNGRAWRLATIPVAAVLVIGGLVLIQGGGDSTNGSSGTDNSPPSVENGDNINSIPPATAGDPTGSPTTPSGATASTQGAGTAAHLVSGGTYSLALPKHWDRTEPPSGATFSASAPDGEADVTLWIKQDPKLDFPTFVSQSLQQLEAVAGSAHIVNRVPAPTAEGTIVTLAADAPAGQPSYQVTLRVAGPYRYYLATTVQPDASPEASQGADLVAGSFTPEAKG